MLTYQNLQSNLAPSTCAFLPENTDMLPNYKTQDDTNSTCKQNSSPYLLSNEDWSCNKDLHALDYLENFTAISSYLHIPRATNSEHCPLCVVHLFLQPTASPQTFETIIYVIENIEVTSVLSYTRIRSYSKSLLKIVFRLCCHFFDTRV